MKQISGAEEFPMIYEDTPSSRGWSINSHCLSVGCTKWLPPQEDSMKREEKSSTAVEKPDNNYLSQVIKVPIKSVKSR